MINKGYLQQHEINYRLPGGSFSSVKLYRMNHRIIRSVKDTKYKSILGSVDSGNYFLTTDILTPFSFNHQSKIPESKSRVLNVRVKLSDGSYALRSVLLVGSSNDLIVYQPDGPDVYVNNKYEPKIELFSSKIDSFFSEVP